MRGCFENLEKLSGNKIKRVEEINRRNYVRKFFT